MRTVQFVIGPEVFPPLDLPDSRDKLSSLRTEIADGLDFGRPRTLSDELCRRLQAQALRLTFHSQAIGPVLDEKADIPVPPAKLHIDGPTAAVRTLAVALRQKLKTQPPSSARVKPGAPGSRGAPVRPQGTARGQRSSGVMEEATTVPDGEEAANNWHLPTTLLQERKPDDWVRLSSSLDDRLRKEFPTLHSCTTGGDHSARPGSGGQMKKRLSGGSVKEHTAAKSGEAGKDDYLRAEESDEDDHSSESSLDIGGYKAAFHMGPNHANGQKGGPGGKHAGAAGRQHFRGSVEGHGGRNAYSMQAAMEIQPLPVLTMNHTHASRFRSMRLDAQTQAYLREKKDVLRVVRYQCPVCSVNHEFRMNKTAAGHGGSAEHQHF